MNERLGWGPYGRSSERGRTLGNTRGFTLLEVLVALVILSIGVLGYMTVQFQSVSGRAFANSLSRALTRGTGALEELRTVNFDMLEGEDLQYYDMNTGEVATFTDFDEGRAYEVDWGVYDWNAVSENPNCFIRELKTLGVRLRWKEKGLEHTSVFFTFERGRKTGDIS